MRCEVNKREGDAEAIMRMVKGEEFGCVREQKLREAEQVLLEMFRNASDPAALDRGSEKLLRIDAELSRRGELKVVK